MSARPWAAVYFDQYMRWAVLTHDRAPFTLPVSQEDYLRRRMAELQEAGAGEVAGRLSARLDAMSPADRGAPACHDVNDLLAAMTSCDDRGRAYVVLNPRYFDPALPASAVQLIVVTSPQEIRGKEDRRHYALRARIFESIDYAALAEMLRR